MSFVAAARDLSIRELAIQASASSNLTTFAAALDPNPSHDEKWRQVSESPALPSISLLRCAISMWWSN